MSVFHVVEIRSYENLVSRVGLSKATITNLIRKGEFPAPRKVREGRKLFSVWYVSDVAEWLSKRSVIQ